MNTWVPVLAFSQILLFIHVSRSYRQGRGPLRQLVVDFYRWYYRLIDRLLDWKLGIQTCRQVPANKVRTESENSRHGKKYQATPYKVLVRAIRTLYCYKISPGNFVDIGCGKGRALVVASKVGFRRLIGVEYSADLCQQARANLEKVEGQPGKTRILHLDATEFIAPSGDCVFFLFNPFSRDVLERVLNNIEQQRQPGDRHFFIYVNPMYIRLFDEDSYSKLSYLDHPHEDFSVAIFASV